MTWPARMTIVLVATACFLLNIKLVQPQSKDSLSPDAPISETIAWLKSHMPYSYTLPTSSNGQVFRWTLGGLHSKDCKLKYDITIQSLDQANSSFDRQRFEVDLAGLNPEIIRIYPATKRDPVRIEFTSLNAKDPELIRQAQAHGGVVVAVKGKAIWQNHRQAEFVREGFVTHASFFTRNEERARELAAALKRGIELCRQNARSE